MIKRKFLPIWIVIGCIIAILMILVVLDQRSNRLKGFRASFGANGSGQMALSGRIKNVLTLIPSTYHYQQSNLIDSEDVAVIPLFKADTMPEAKQLINELEIDYVYIPKMFNHKYSNTMMHVLMQNTSLFKLVKERNKYFIFERLGGHVSPDETALKLASKGGGEFSFSGTAQPHSVYCLQMYVSGEGRVKILVNGKPSIDVAVKKETKNFRHQFFSKKKQATIQIITSNTAKYSNLELFQVEYSQYQQQ